MPKGAYSFLGVTSNIMSASHRVEWILCTSTYTICETTIRCKTCTGVPKSWLRRNRWQSITCRRVCCITSVCSRMFSLLSVERIRSRKAIIYIQLVSVVWCLMRLTVTLVMWVQVPRHATFFWNFSGSQTLGGTSRQCGSGIWRV